ncbi:TonB-dependent receptor plug domain-containing protein [Thermomonas aquatica]|uniref:TonB-dependent receptor n=1 Tax=Thermomonas aquatica TaxID=2202149 RepID=A0A5B7ZTM9_9GAMM|nr:TonB-dependent receptor [Thermomonas aquatica]QDA58320.1 TonB-dependent receptor [Thermomonas aquatica]
MAVRTNIRFTRSPLTLALAAAMLLPAASAMAQDQSSDKTDATATQDGTKTLDQVTVVGSRIKRVEIEGPAPITVITRADIEREGFQTVGDMLQTLTQNTTSSFTGDLAVSGFTPNAQVVNLRNLGPGYTLTLVNGRRPAQYPQPYNRDNNVVNVKAIPSSIVERVEVLTGGASAIYGSDAVAGVVNIVTRENIDGHNLRLTVGTTSAGGGDRGKLEFSGGASGDRWSTVYALQYEKWDPVFASQRDFLSDTRRGPLGSITNPALSLIAIRGNTRPGGAVNTNAFYPGQAACDAFGYTTVTTATRGTYCGSFTQPASRSIFNAGSNYSGYINGRFDVSDSLQFFGDFTYYHADGKSSSGTEFWGTSGDRFLTTSSGATTSLYYDPQAGGLLQLQRVFNPFELGGNEAATTLYDENTYNATIGANGTLGDRFDWEVSYQTSRYEYTADRPRLLAKAVHDYFLGPQQGWASSTGVAGGIYPVYSLNLARWYAPITPEIYRSFATRVINRGETSSSNFNFTLSGDLFDLPAGPLGFAAILESGTQETDLKSDPRLDQLRPIDAGTVYNLTSSGRTHGTRDRYAAGVELNVPIFSKLDMDIAARWDKYDDITAVDDAITYNIGLKYRPVDSLLLRASYATSFRAPDMQLVYAEGAASYSTVLDEYSCRSGTGLGLTTGPRTRTQCNVTNDPTIYQAQTLIAGNPLLKEEEGKSFTAGFVWDVADNMSVSIDYWRIKLADQATQLSSAYLLENEANCRLGVKRDGTAFEHEASSAYCQNITSLITRTVGEPGSSTDNRISRINSAYINAALTDTSGIDASWKYSLTTDRIGKFNFDVGYSLMLTNKYKQFDTDPLVDYRNDPIISDQRSRVRGSIGWSLNTWSATLFGTRYGSNGSFAAVNGVNAAGGAYSSRLEPYMLYNISLGKRINENLSLMGTVVNVTNNTFRPDNSNTGYPYYDYTIGADPMGRRFTLTAEYKF